MARCPCPGLASRTTLLTLCVLLGGAGAQAQDAADPAAEAAAPLDEYRVELIVFEYEGLAGSSEDWREREEPAPEMDDEAPEEADAGSMDAAAEPPAAAGADPAEDVPVFRYLPLSEADLELAEVFALLRASGEHAPLLHVAWQQPGFDRETTRPLDLERLRALPARLAGEATLYRSRFLHLALDLRLRAESGETPGAGVFSDDSVAALEPVVYRLRESRKLRSGELHYFDHPRFGALARVTPVEAPEAELTPPATGGR